jgi:hypothetical protein
MNEKLYLDLKIENSIANIYLKRSPINAFSIDFLNEIIITLKEVNKKKCTSCNDKQLDTEYILCWSGFIYINR